MRHREAKQKPRPVLIRKGDTVKIMAGRDAGKSGRVLSVDPVKNRVVVEHVNIIKRHTRPNPQRISRAALWKKKRPSTFPT